MGRVENHLLKKSEDKKGGGPLSRKRIRSIDGRLRITGYGQGSLEEVIL